MKGWGFGEFRVGRYDMILGGDLSFSKALSLLGKGRWGGGGRGNIVSHWVLVYFNEYVTLS